MMKIRTTAGTSISTLIKLFVLVYFAQNPQHKSSFRRNCGMKKLTVNMTSFLKIIKFSSGRKRKVQGFVRWKEEWMISATVL